MVPTSREKAGGKLNAGGRPHKLGRAPVYLGASALICQNGRPPHRRALWFVVPHHWPAQGHGLWWWSLVCGQERCEGEHPLCQSRLRPRHRLQAVVPHPCLPQHQWLFASGACHAEDSPHPRLSSCSFNPSGRRSLSCFCRCTHSWCGPRPVLRHLRCRPSPLLR